MGSLRKLVISSLELLATIAFFLMVISGAIKGAQAGGVSGFVGGTVLGFIGAVIIFGILFLLMEINENIKKQNK